MTRSILWLTVAILACCAARLTADDQAVPASNATEKAANGGGDRQLGLFASDSPDRPAVQKALTVLADESNKAPMDDKARDILFGKAQFARR